MRFSILTSAVAVLALVGCAQEEAEPGPTSAGSIRLKEFYGAMGVYACFREGPAVAPTYSVCKTSQLAGCKMSECDTPLPIRAVPQPTTVSSDLAGTITVVGTHTNGGVATASNKGGEDVSADFGPPHWAGGTTLTVTGSGGRVPAFESKVTLPAPIHLTSPNCGFACEGLPSTLTVEWTGDAQAPTFVSLGASRTSGDTLSSLFAECHVLRSPATLPDEVVARLAAFGEADGYSLSIGAVGQTRFVSGDFDILLEAVGASSGFARFVPAKK